MIMIYKENGTRYNKYSLWELRKNKPYDYENDGLVNKLLSNKIVTSKNHILNVMMTYYEKSIIFLLKYVDRLKHFKNYHWKNR